MRVTNDGDVPIENVTLHDSFIDDNSGTGGTPIFTLTSAALTGYINDNTSSFANAGGTVNGSWNGEAPNDNLINTNGVTLAVGDVLRVSYVVTWQANIPIATVVNTARTSGNPTSGTLDDISAVRTKTVDVSAELTVTKSSFSQSRIGRDNAGNYIMQYQVRVKNTGGQRIEDITIVDPFFTDNPGNTFVSATFLSSTMGLALNPAYNGTGNPMLVGPAGFDLDPNQEAIIRYRLVWTRDAAVMTNNAYTNTATATGTGVVDGSVTDSDSHSESITGTANGLDIQKTNLVQYSYPESDRTIHLYQIVVRQNGNNLVTGIEVVDDFAAANGILASCIVSTQMYGGFSLSNGTLLSSNPTYNNAYTGASPNAVVATGGVLGAGDSFSFKLEFITDNVCKGWDTTDTVDNTISTTGSTMSGNVGDTDIENNRDIVYRPVTFDKDIADLTGGVSYLVNHGEGEYSVGYDITVHNGMSYYELDIDTIVDDFSGLNPGVDVIGSSVNRLAPAGNANSHLCFKNDYLAAVPRELAAAGGTGVPNCTDIRSGTLTHIDSNKTEEFRITIRFKPNTETSIQNDAIMTAKVFNRDVGIEAESTADIGISSSTGEENGVDASKDCHNGNCATAVSDLGDGTFIADSTRYSVRFNFEATNTGNNIWSGIQVEDAFEDLNPGFFVYQTQVHSCDADQTVIPTNGSWSNNGNPSGTDVFQAKTGANPLNPLSRVDDVLSDPNARVVLPGQTLSCDFTIFFEAPNSADQFFNEVILSGDFNFDGQMDFEESSMFDLFFGLPAGVIDLEVDKSASVAEVGLDEVFTYTIEVQNKSFTHATNVTLTDVLPSALMHVENRPSVGTYAPGNGQWSIGTISGGETVTLEIDVKAPAGTASQVVENCAHISGHTQTDWDSSPNNTHTADEDDDDCVEVEINGSVDLSVTKVASVDEAIIGENFTFEIVVSNDGDADATNVELTDVWPNTQLELVSATGDGDFDEQTFIWTLALIPTDESRTLTITAVARVGTDTETAENCIHVTDVDQTDEDSMPGNFPGTTEDDDACDSVFIRGPIDLSIAKTLESSGTFFAGDPVDFKVVVTNSSVNSSGDFEVSDILDGNFDFVSATGDGTYNELSGIWSVDDLGLGESAQMIIRVEIRDGFGDGELHNCAQVFSTLYDDVDSTPGNLLAGTPQEDDESCASVYVTGEQLGLDLEKLLQSFEPVANMPGLFDLTYSFDLTNYGNQDLKQISLLDDLTALSFDVVTVTPPTATGTLDRNPNFNGDSNQDLLLSTSTLAAGATQFVTLTLRIDVEGETGPWTNTAVVSGISDRDKRVEDTADETISITDGPAINVLKSLTAGPTPTGTLHMYQVTYDILVSNIGNAVLSNVQLVDDLDETFGVDNYTVNSLIALDSLTPIAVADYDPDDGFLLAGTDSLAIGEVQVIQLTVTFDSEGENDGFNNIVTAAAQGPSGESTGDTDDASILIIERPSIDLEKTVVSGPTLLSAAAGTYEVTYRLDIENDGSVPLSGLQVNDDFAGIGFSSIQSVAVTTDLSDDHDGTGTDTTLLDGTDILAVDGTASITVRVVFTLSGNNEGLFSNRADVIGTSPNGEQPVDQADADIIVVQTPQIDLEKQLAGFTPVAGSPGQFDVRFVFDITNPGELPLVNVALNDVLTDLGPTIVTVGDPLDVDGGLDANTNYNGDTVTDLLLNTSELAAGATETITLDIRINTNGANGPWTNDAVVSAEAPNGDGVEDTSDETFAVIEGGGLSLLKTLTAGPTFTGTTNEYIVSYAYRLSNIGDVPLTLLQVTDDLDAVFGAGNYSAIDLATGDVLTLNEPAFNGSTNTNMLSGNNALAVGESKTLTLTLRIDTQGASQGFENIAEAVGTTPGGDVIGDQDDADFVILESPSLVIDKEIISGPTLLDAATGLYAVDYQIVVKNDGNVPLSGVQVTDDLNALGFSSIEDISVTAVGLDENTDFGTADTDLLDGDDVLAAKTQATIDVELEFILTDGNDGLFTNAANGMGTSPNGQMRMNTDDVSFVVDVDSSLNLTKYATDTRITAQNSFETDFRLIVQNGNADLVGVRLSEGLIDGWDAAGTSAEMTELSILSSTLATPLTVWSLGAQDQSGANVTVATAATLPENSTTVFSITVAYDVANGDQGDLPIENTAQVVGTDALGDLLTAIGSDSVNSEDLLDAAPALVVSKEAHQAIEITGEDDNYRVTFTVDIANPSNATLYNVVMTDDIVGTLGSGGWSDFVVTNLQSSGNHAVVATDFVPNTMVTNWYTGDVDLAPGASDRLTFTLEFDSNTIAGPFQNIAAATGQDALGNTLSANDDAFVEIAAEGEIGLAKALTSIVDASVNGGPVGAFDLTFRFTIENTGNLPLTNIRLIDNIRQSFPNDVDLLAITSAPNVISGTIGNGNAGYEGGADFSNNGTIDNEVLDGTGTLAVGASGVVDFTVRINPNGVLGPLENTAIALGLDSQNNSQLDVSTNGLDVDPTNDGTPSNDLTPTPIPLPYQAEVGIAKDMSVTSSGPKGNGPWTVRIDYNVANLGNVDIDDVSIEENLVDVFGANPRDWNNLILNPAIVGTADAFGLNGFYTGNPSTGATNLVASNSTLEPGDEFSFSLTLEVLNLTDTSSLNSINGDYLNQVTIVGEDHAGVEVSDDSDDGVDPDGNNGNGSEDDPTPLIIPNIGVAKSVSDVTAEVGTFLVTYEIVIENTGGTVLEDISLDEPLEDWLGSAFIDLVVDPDYLVSPQPAFDQPDFNGGFMGRGNNNIFDGTSGTMNPGEIVVIDLTVRLDPSQAASPVPLENQVVVTASDPATDAQVTDLSDAGTDPSGDNGEGGPDDPTPVELPELGVAKQMNVIDFGPTDNGPWRVKVDYTIANLGNVVLSNLSMNEDLVAVFGDNPEQWSDLIFTTTFTGTAPDLELSDSFTGNVATGSIDMIEVGSVLNPGDEATFSLTLLVTELSDASSPSNIDGDYVNSVILTGKTPAGDMVSDQSDDGTDPNSNNGENDRQDPSPLSIPNIGLAKEVLMVTPQDGLFDVTFQFVMANTGGTTLEDLSLIDDLATELGSAFAGVVADPQIVPGQTDADEVPTLNGDFNGSGVETNIFEGDDGVLLPDEQITVAFTVRVDPNAASAPQPLLNQALASGTDPVSNKTVDDLSDAGSNPSGDNGEGGPDDPTPVPLAELGVAKDMVVLSSGPTGNGPWIVQIDCALENTGNLEIIDLSMTDDLTAVFGPEPEAWGFAELNANVGGTATSVYPNPFFTGNGAAPTSAELLDIGSSLLPGETATLRVTLEVRDLRDTSSNTGIRGDYLNQVRLMGETLAGQEVSDLSDHGLDPDGDNGEGTTFDPTPLVIPNIGVAKSITNVTFDDRGDFTVDYRVVMENTGGAILTDVSLIEPLLDQLGSAFQGITSAPTFDLASTDATVRPTLASFSGVAPNTNIFDGDDGTFEPGQRIVVAFSLLLDPSQANAPVPLENQVTASGRDVGSNTVVDDLSDNGTEPEGDNGEGGTDDPTPAILPELGVAKDMEVIDFGPTENGPWTIRITYAIANLGNVVIDNLSMEDDLTAVFGDQTDDWDGVVYSTNFTGSAPQLDLHDAYTGDAATGSIDLIETGSVLEPGDNAVFTVDVLVRTLTNTSSPTMIRGDYRNQVTLEGRDPQGQGVTDTSDHGVDPNSDNGEGDRSDVTPLIVPNINVAKSITDVVPLGGLFDVTYRVIIENTGGSVLEGITLSEPMETQLLGGFAGLRTDPSIVDGGTDATVDPTLNGGYTGFNPDIEIFNVNTGELRPDERIEVTFVAILDPNGVDAPNPLENQVTVSGTDPESGKMVDDLSDNGTDPNGDNGEGGPDDPTPALLPEVGLAKDVTAIEVLDNGLFDVTFQMTLANLGNTLLEDMTLIDDVFTQLGGTDGAYVSLTGAPVIVVDTTSPNSSIQINSNYLLPVSNTDILDPNNANRLGVEDQVTIVFTIRIFRDAPNAPDEFFNQALASGTSPEDVTVTDLSDDGLNPEGPNNYGDEDDPTPIPVIATGVVYDSYLRNPIEGAVVTVFNGQGVPVDPSCLLTGENPQSTLSNGEYYAFLTYMHPTCVAGDTFGIGVNGLQAGFLNVTPDGNGAATLGGVGLPQGVYDAVACHTDARDVDPTTFGCQIQPQPTAPDASITGNPGTNYFLMLTTGTTSEDIVTNNHIPLDPKPRGPETFRLSKIATKDTGRVGESLVWRLVAKSTIPYPIFGAEFRDQLPLGLSYEVNSASLSVEDQAGVVVFDGPLEPTVTGPVLSWPGIAVPPYGEVTFDFRTQINIAADVGTITNIARVYDDLGDPFSNIAEADATILVEEVFDCSTIIGQVFDDVNASGYQDQGERGLPGGRVTALVKATALSINVDANGRFHIPCAAVPDADIGSNIILKLDARTLPSGYRITTENPRTVRATRGKATKVNFGASIDRIVRVDFNRCAFVPGSVQFTDHTRQGIAVLVDKLKEGKSSLRLAYRANQESDQTTKARTERLKKLVQELWRQNNGPYELDVEVEIVRVVGEKLQSCGAQAPVTKTPVKKAAAPSYSEPAPSPAPAPKPSYERTTQMHYGTPAGVPAGSVKVTGEELARFKIEPGRTLYRDAEGRYFHVKTLQTPSNAMSGVPDGSIIIQDPASMGVTSVPAGMVMLKTPDGRLLFAPALGD